MPAYAKDEKSLFLAALEQSAKGEREAYLRIACSDDPELLKRVKVLLSVHDESQGPLDVQVSGVELAFTRDLPITEGPGTVIGPYKLREQIGEGGFGLVFMAEQQEPIRRKVAIKVIKPGMDSRQVIARFEAERQALALMDHPNIARVLEVGETGCGQPYFAMELVRGMPITDHCDEYTLPLRARLELFVSVCQAVLHAHQKGIIHRDIKPSNVMVTLHDGVSVVKVIDFGIAKALGQQLTDKTLCTGYAQLVGTPLYMSPEQAEMSGLDIDTRSDIYSLGVLLYELLTGTTPFDKKRLREVDYDEMRRIIREDEPAKPSTRMTTLGQAGITVSARRQSDPKRLSQLFRGELDWIVMKALDKDRNRRYETSGSLAADVQRFLHDEPVLACPPSSKYRILKFARLHRWPLSLASLAAASLLIIAVGSLISSFYLSEALQEAENNRRRAEGAEKTAMGRLFDSLVSQAQASRLSHRMGQQFESLKSLAEAAKIARNLDTFSVHAPVLRNEVIACLALPDVRVVKEWDGWPSGSMLVEFDGDLKRYVRTDRQGIVHIHRVLDGAELWHFPGFGPENFGEATYPHLSPDGCFLLLMRGAHVKLWSLAGPEPAPIPVQLASCTGCTFSPDSRELVLAHADGSIHLYDLPSGREQKQFKGVLNARFLAFHPKARQLAIEHGTGVQILDLETGVVLAELPQPTDRCIAWHPNGGTLAILGDDLMIHLWDVATSKPIARMEGSPNSGQHFTFSHSGDLLAGGGDERLLHLWDTRTGAQLFSTPAVMQGLRFSSDDQLLATEVGVDDNKLRFWQVARSSGYRTLTSMPADGVATSPKERLVAMGTLRDGVGIWDLSSGALLTILDSVGHSVVFEPSGALLTSGKAGLLRWPIQRDLVVPGLLRIGPAQKLPLPSKTNIAISSDGRVLVSAGSRFADSRGLVWHRDLPEPPLQLDFHEDPRNIGISPDGQWVATGSWWGAKVKISAARTGKLIHELPVEDGSFVDFSPDGRWLATTGGGCRLWTVDSWREGPYIGGTYLAFSPDGKLIAVETGQGVIRLVDSATIRECARLEDPHKDKATRLCFSQDGTQLIVACNNNIHVWDLRIIRGQLAEMDLDWELPKYPPAATGDDSKPLRVQVELGELVSRQRALANNENAWKLATDPEANSLDCRRAIELANEAVRLAPEEGAFWNTLGVAHYRARHWDESIRDLEKSMQLMAGKFESYNTFFMAMAQWQRNDREQARKWYDQAVAWMEKNQATLSKTDAEELRRFHAEADVQLQLQTKK